MKAVLLNALRLAALTALYFICFDGCRVLAMLWESAWREGTQGQTIDPDRLRAAPASRLMELYSDQNFLPSVSLDEIGAHL
jgi:hypothetical protein